MDYKGYTIRIEQDGDNESPREWDNLGTMICFHKRYILGDDHDLKISDFNSMDEVKEYIRNELDGYIILPLYLYDHGGITMNTTGFECPWDSGMVGYIYITAKKIRDEYSVKRISKKLKGRIIEYLINEVKTYDQFLTGDIWGYTVLKDGVDINSCWGFYGEEFCRKEAQGVIDYRASVDRKKKLDQIKKYIKHRVPLHKRIFKD